MSESRRSVGSVRCQSVFWVTHVTQQNKIQSDSHFVGWCFYYRNTSNRWMKSGRTSLIWSCGNNTGKSQCWRFEWGNNLSKPQSYRELHCSLASLIPPSFIYSHRIHCWNEEEWIIHIFMAIMTKLYSSIQKKTYWQLFGESINDVKDFHNHKQIHWENNQQMNQCWR